MLSQNRSSRDPNFFDLDYCESIFFCHIGKQNNFWDPKSFVLKIFCQAQPQLNFNFNFEAEIALFSDNTATQPPTLALGDTPKIINQKSIFQGF